MERALVTTARPPLVRERRSVVARVGRKVNTVDSGWKKGFFGTGILLEDQETKSFTLFQRLQDKKVLSTVEKSGLLGKAEKAGLTLSKIESLGLLSTAEKLGVLALVESAFLTDGATITSYSIPFLLGALGIFTLAPQDNSVEVALTYGGTALCITACTTLFVAGFVIKSLQEDDSDAMI